MKLTQIMDVYTEGIGRVIASGYAKRKCIPFLERMRLLPMLWVRDNGIQLKYVTHIDFKTKDDYFDSMGYCEPNCSFCESDKKHYQQMSEFFDEMLEHLNFHTFVVRCSRCAKASAPYVGIISGKTVFAFCVDCRDELTLKKNTVIAAQERIGA